MPRTLQNTLHLVIVIAALLLQACAVTPKDGAKAESQQQGFISCESPRPDICTREYRPVCGHVDTGTRCVSQPCESARHRTFSNACSACANRQVIGYEFGSCESYGK